MSEGKVMMLGLVVSLIVIFGGAAGLMYGFDKPACHQQADLMKVESSYGLWQGCMIKENDRWYPMRQLRTLR